MSAAAIINEIIENLEEIDKDAFPPLNVVEFLVSSIVGESCKDHVLIRDTILRIYTINKIMTEKEPRWSVDTNEFSWILKILNDSTPDDIANLHHQDILDLLSTRVDIEEHQPLSVQMGGIVSRQHALERLWTRLGRGSGGGEEAMQREQLEQEDCKAGLLAALPAFVSSNLGLGGVLSTQTDLALSLGDFETAFLVLNDEVRRIEKRMRISHDKSRSSDELEVFLVRLQEMQLDEAMRAIEWDKELMHMTIAYRKSLRTHAEADFGDLDDTDSAPSESQKKAAPRGGPVKGKRRMSSLASFISSAVQVEVDRQIDLEESSTQKKTLAEDKMQQWVEACSEAIRRKTKQFTDLCEAAAGDCASASELETVEWYSRHVRRRTVVREKIDRTREILAERMLNEIKDIKDNHAAILMKARDVYVGGVQAQRQLEREAAEMLAAGQSADQSYTLSVSEIPTSVSKKKSVKPVSLVFCKAAILNALDNLQHNQLKQFEESNEQSLQLPALVEEIRSDVEAYTGSYADRMKNLFNEAFSRYSKSVLQGNEQELAAEQAAAAQSAKSKAKR